MKRLVFGLVGVLVLVLVLALAVFHRGVPWWRGDGDRNHVYDGPAGSIRYQVHLPPQHDSFTRLPIVMAIHGCAMSGFGWNSMKATTGFNELADREGFIVVYPTQRLFRDPINCWNSDDPRHQQRHAGEPALLAGVAREVVRTYRGDPDQVHVAGASSGAGTAVILAATYPDVFATVTSVAGGEYGLNQVDPEDPEATPPTHTARQAWAQMGDRARRVPLLVVQGSEDGIVPPVVATRLTEQWISIADLVDDGRLDASLTVTEHATVVPKSRESHGYRRSRVATLDGSTLVESYWIAGMGHAWPGPNGEGLFTDRAGPDASELVWDFAQRHPRPRLR